MRQRIVLSLLVGLALVLPAPSAALGSAVHRDPYALIDMGTFGGPHAELNGPAIQITSQGAVLGSADTTIADTDFPNFNPFLAPDPHISHAFEWQNGQLTDLRALAGNNSSAVFEVNGRGVGAGSSETRALDPLTGYPSEHAVLFKGGTVTDLGTLPGGQESQALAINDRGEIAGFANNGIPDPVSMFNFNNWTTQTRAFIWQDGVMHDLGTLGGPDADLATLNARGQVAGDSFTNSTANAATGTPTTHPYLWTDGRMRDLGTLGGTSTLTKWLNNRGQVVGERATSPATRPPIPSSGTANTFAISARSAATSARRTTSTTPETSSAMRPCLTATARMRSCGGTE